MSDANALLPWLCKKKDGHVLGQMRRTGRGRMVLLLYAEAIDPRNPGHEPPEVRAILYGPALDIRCSKCGAARRWGKDGR
jgi:hypothetical protein